MAQAILRGFLVHRSYRRERGQMEERRQPLQAVPLPQGTAIAGELEAQPQVQKHRAAAVGVPQDLMVRVVTG